MDWIGTSADGKDLVVLPSGRPVALWGFNYDRDDRMRLIEEFWHDEWDRVESAFRYMRSAGGHVVRIHLQLQEFMVDATTPHATNLAQLARLVSLAEELSLYLDVTGLGSYRNQEPDWYSSLDEAERWAVQAQFWRVVAGALSSSPAVAFYGLINEPGVPVQEVDSYVHPLALGTPPLYYCNFVSRGAAGREPRDVAVQWIRMMTAAIREVDQRHLITIGLLPTPDDVTRPTGAFGPEEIGTELDLLCPHIYPRAGAIDRAVAEVGRWRGIGKPVVIGETFPIECDVEEFELFLTRATPCVSGCMCFCWSAEEPRDGQHLAAHVAYLDHLSRRS